jgi:hypothetical protein
MYITTLITQEIFLQELAPFRMNDRLPGVIGPVPLPTLYKRNMKF